MSWISHSVPREAEDPPPEPPSEIARLEVERAALQASVRRGIRSQRQERILRRIAEITREILTHGS
jgi:hypothetical protein